MHDWRSLSHVRWKCKYHVVITPKYRKKVFYGRMRRQIGEIIREFCRQRGIELLEGHAVGDHIHLVLSIPAKGLLSLTAAVRIAVLNFVRHLSDAEGSMADLSDLWPISPPTWEMADLSDSCPVWPG